MAHPSGALVWLPWSGGVKAADGKARWPARVVDSDAGGARVQKARVKG